MEKWCRRRRCYRHGGNKSSQKKVVHYTVATRAGTNLSRLDISNRVLLKIYAHYRAGLYSCVARTLAFRGFAMPPPQDAFYAGLGQAVRIGTELLASLIVGGGLGWVVDAYLLGSTPWGLVVGLILGVAAGVRNAYRAAQRWQNSSDKPGQR